MGNINIGYTSGYGVLDSGYSYTSGYGYQNPITNRCYYVEDTIEKTYSAASTYCSSTTPSSAGYLFPIGGTFEYAMAAKWTMGIRTYWLYGTYSSSTTWATHTTTFSSGGCTGFCQFWCQGQFTHFLRKFLRGFYDCALIGLEF